MESWWQEWEDSCAQDERQRLIRLVVARDWAVACSRLQRIPGDEWVVFPAMFELAAARCAEDFVDEMLGEKR